MNGLSAASYLRAVDQQVNVSCRLLFAKSKLAPIRPMAVLQLELTAAALAVKVDRLLFVPAYGSIIFLD